MDDKVIVWLARSAEYDPSFMDDIGVMCKRLGIYDILIYPIDKDKGDYASNVDGYGDKQWNTTGIPPFHITSCVLAVSWRFRNDPDFRREELPKLEAAMAEVLEKCKPRQKTEK
jgi:hypothetical protein